MQQAKSNIRVRLPHSKKVESVQLKYAKTKINPQIAPESNIRK